MGDLDGNIGEYILDEGYGRANFRNFGIAAGQEKAASDYPYAIYRERGQIEQLGTQTYQSWAGAKRARAGKRLADLASYVKKPSIFSDPSQRSSKIEVENFKREAQRLQYWVNSWDNQVSEAQRLYVSAFVGAYLEKVKELDEKEAAKRQPPPQPKPVYTPQPQPAATPQPATLATMQGATVVLKGVDRSKPNEYVYSLELSDPEHFDGVEKTEWVVYFEGASVPSTAAAAVTATYAMSGSDVTYAYGSSTPQKSVRKPKGSYLRSPK